MTDDIKKSTAGRKKSARASDINSLVEKARFELMKGDARLVNDLPELLELQRSIALGYGLGKSASITNRKSAIDSCIDRAEKYALKTSDMYVAEMSDKEVEETLPEETKQVANGAPEVVDNMTFEEKKRQWLLDKAKKDAEKSE